MGILSTVRKKDPNIGIRLEWVPMYKVPVNYVIRFYEGRAKVITSMIVYSWGANTLQVQWLSVLEGHPEHETIYVYGEDRALFPFQVEVPTDG